MPTNPGVYAAVTDLRKGDIPLPSYMGDGSSYINEAADEIDAQLGHIYVTPLVIEATAANRPSILLLKKINWLLASGRLILDMAAASESTALHSYGNSMLKEGLTLLAQIGTGDIVLAGATRIDSGDTEKSFTGPAIFNEDPSSLVQDFYDSHNPNKWPIGEPLPGVYAVEPYRETTP